MKNKKTTKKAEKKTDIASGVCKDKLCPFHGSEPVKLRGRTFEGIVIRKLPGRVAIEFERIISVPKFERYEKRKTKLHAKLMSCLRDSVNVGDLIKIEECRPLSRIIHFVVTQKIKSSEELK